MLCEPLIGNSLQSYNHIYCIEMSFFFHELMQRAHLISILYQNYKQYTHCIEKTFFLHEPMLREQLIENFVRSKNHTHCIEMAYPFHELMLILKGNIFYIFTYSLNLIISALHYELIIYNAVYGMSV